MILLMGIRYRGAGDVDELGYVYVNEILDVRVNVHGWYILDVRVNVHM